MLETESPRGGPIRISDAKQVPEDLPQDATRGDPQTHQTPDLSKLFQNEWDPFEEDEAWERQTKGEATSSAGAQETKASEKESGETAASARTTETKTRKGTKTTKAKEREATALQESLKEEEAKRTFWSGQAAGGAQHLVRRATFEACLGRIRRDNEWGLDTETTGLRYYHNDKLFSIIIANEEEQFYFNFNPGPQDEYVLPREWIPKFQDVFNNPDAIWYVHNAKFDMGMLRREGLEIQGKVHCTYAMARLERNDHLTYSLEACAERIGEKKDDTVKLYVQKHKLFTKERKPGKKVQSKTPHFDRVPIELVVPYALKDALTAFRLGKHQERAINENRKKYLEGKVLRAAGGCVEETEILLTKTLSRMERTGLRIDEGYCKRAVSWFEHEADAAQARISAGGCGPFTNSSKFLSKLFQSELSKFKKTEKGNPQFDSDVLLTLDNPLAKDVLRYRDCKSKSDFFNGFIYHADSNGDIHPNFNQGGTGTGRMSSSEPNFQNLTSEEEDNGDAFKVRSAIIPREGFCLVSVDYKAMEFRALVDRAKDKFLAQKILGGEDPHEATAKMVGITRKQAKTLNFGLLYGMGVGKLGKSLGVDESVARELKQKYFRNLPSVAHFISKVTNRASLHGYVFNPFGRISFFPNKDFAYKAVNYVIQGTCADVTKSAMVKVDGYLADKKSRMLLSIHDELLFEIHESEWGIIDQIGAIMKEAYPRDVMPFDVSIDHSFTNWGELVEGKPVK